jgi:flagellar basal-body rod protein FlgB
MTQAGVFDLAEQRLAWLEQRQRTLAQNVANANTPGYQPQDLTPFAAALARAGTAAPARTQAGHLQGSQGGALQADAHVKPAERGPDGNAVGIEDELVKVADTEQAQELTTGLYTKYMSLFRLALGRSQ